MEGHQGVLRVKRAAENAEGIDGHGGAWRNMEGHGGH